VRQSGEAKTVPATERVYMIEKRSW